MAVATSWIYKRKWQLDWKEYNHILNPKTLNNNFDISSITIISSYCVIPDVYDITCISMWKEKSKGF
jgi:thiamine biosynthesis lipoprotein ApbE